LPRHGIEPVLITSLGKEYDPSIRTVKASDPTISVPPKRLYGNCIKYSINTARLASSGYDIIDANGHLSLFPCFMASKLSGKPLVATIHDIYGSSWKSMYRSPLSFAGKYAERFLCKLPYKKLVVLNNTVRKFMISIGVPEERLEVIYSGIDIRKIDRTKAGKRVEGRIVYVGRLAPQKNLDILFRAFSMLEGEGSEAGKLKSLSNSLGIDVEFTGKVSNEQAIREMKEASILALTSSRENFGIVPLEAMRCGAVVVSTRTEGPADYIRSGENGFLVDIESAEQMAEKLDILLSDRNLMSRMRKKGLGTSSKFDWDKIVGEIARLYKEILG
ncbi:MAG: glycosyltransferase family 4 protein, partial [Candidatus Aenigmarchaeota archaeon]|nr:glycosyltransferase family 4 protein [Candidatus Aenigmarchaeota archaeon]